MLSQSIFYSSMVVMMYEFVHLPYLFILIASAGMDDNLYIFCFQSQPHSYSSLNVLYG